ncbi:CpsD/CapB family tyrosine-protein kinase [Sporosarcina trichiuri]|uniref:CpsD/CapB family tyrosine-protein kinase n=1 Tax=Sporosarcina trichiuri TaxID=3056445 RepID=UPI0025B491B6|nr:CpsD/CapB family tyrosine-protein kinase [Sporosarcina sp. 0.2-SM1T-5]WJY26428.1 CpsD/CapB family tyrosine-protein kinase [Sporosarcina sp. 0.2-SM1T-5]
MAIFKKQKKPLQKAARKLITVDNPKSIISEQYRTIRTNIHFSSADTELRTIMLTSSSPSEGKSTSAANIAVVFAQEGRKVLLIDADMRKPTMHHTFHVNNGTGLSAVLTRQAEAAEAIIPTDIEHLSVMPCGPIPPNPAELIGSQTMKALIAQLKEQFDVIVFDAPPLLSVADAQILSNECDGTILVVNTGSTEKDNALKAKETLQSANARILGVLMNNYTLAKDHYYYQYYGTAE